MLELAIPQHYPFPQIERRVSSKDTMLADAGDHYLQVGLSALNVITRAAQGCGELKSILDMPCGHGRITRVLRAAFPKASIFASDLDNDGVRFCAETFGAVPLQSSVDFSTLNFGRRFDLIWVGSLLSHLPPDPATAFIAFALRHLSPNGAAVVTSLGPYVAGRMQTAVSRGDVAAYGVPRVQAQQILNDYYTLGFGYARYPDAEQEYGVALTNRTWMQAVVEHNGGRMRSYHDHGWDNHQDVSVFGLQ